jgi:hypothetical protein
MKTKWKATVSNPLGQEAYDMLVTEENNLISATVSNNKGSVILTEINSGEQLVLTADIETPMRTKVILSFFKKNYLNDQTFLAKLNIENFSEMLVECVKYE